MNYWIFLIPVITALIGWVIHALAVQLFIHRILPARKKSIAIATGKLASAEFDSFVKLEQRINDPRNMETMLPLIEVHIDTFLNKKLKEEMPMISMFIGTKTTDKLKEVFMKEIQSIFPEVIGKFAGNLKAGMDIEGSVSNRINMITTADINQFTKGHLNRELSTFKLLGAITGFISGLVAALAIFLI
jgi:uncharacterized membrane protein YheB (UPF0754 family)